MTRRTIAAAAVTMFVALAAAPWARGMGYPGLYDRQVRQLVSSDEAARTRGIGEFRRMGPDGLMRLQRYWTATGELATVGRGVRLSVGEAERVRLAAAERERLREAIDKVAGQRDATAAWLYWHTDLAAARQRAAVEGKPILSLRLLGELTDEYSCANSRFFRTVLYANPDVAAYLREHYVLHWSSERPAPVVTIDFGDGRVVRRTLTGNSIHYVLDAEGRVVDALPGLYAPADFLRIVRVAHDAAVGVSRLGETEREAALAAYHQSVAADIDNRFRQGLRLIGVEAAGAVVRAKPDAADAAPRARGKRVIEAPILAALDPAWADKLAADMTGERWGRLADARLAGGHVLHAASMALMRSQNAAAYDADPALFDRTVAKFERMIVVDTMRNELLLRRVIHRWLAEQAERTMPMAALNERVYRDLFLTPAGDASVGLLPADVYTGHGADDASVGSLSSR